MRLANYFHGFEHEPILTVNFVVLFMSNPFETMSLISSIPVILGFESISGMSKSYDKEFIQEGGRNDHLVALKAPTREPYKITFNRGYISDEDVSYHRFLDPLRGNVGALEDPGLGTILVLGRHREVKSAYSFISDGAIEWTLGELNASRSERLIETFTITHHGLTSVSPVGYLSSVIPHEEPEPELKPKEKV